MTRRLFVYAKRPLPGYAKTRLAASIGKEEAAGVYARILYTHLLELAEADLPDVDLELSVASPSDVPFFAQAFPEFDVRSQRAGDLGDRLAGSFEEAFAVGAEAAIVTTSDTPGLSLSLIRAAFKALESAPIVIGPCTDGGYYLIGMRAPGAPLFVGVSWETSHVLRQTEKLAQAQGLEITYLPERFDVDTADDLAAWRSAQ